jgi:hypothetical protein
MALALCFIDVDAHLAGLLSGELDVERTDAVPRLILLGKGELRHGR